jgi:hypothetical protein
MLLYVSGVVAGLLTGWCIFKLRFRNGDLKMTETDDKYVYTLFIDDMERIARRKYLLLKIDRHTRK